MIGRLSGTRRRQKPPLAQVMLLQSCNLQPQETITTEMLSNQSHRGNGSRTLPTAHHEQRKPGRRSPGATMHLALRRRRSRRKLRSSSALDPKNPTCSHVVCACQLIGTACSVCIIRRCGRRRARVAKARGRPLSGRPMKSVRMSYQRRGSMKLRLVLHFRTGPSERRGWCSVRMLSPKIGGTWYASSLARNDNASY